MTHPTVGQTLELTVERLGFGGFAIARHEGLAVFVPFGAPGDRVQVEVTEVQKNFVRSKLLAVLAAGPHRV